MPLKTLVKVSNITNLSDARYCAGMGVDMLGFSVIGGAQHHIAVPLYQQIRGWVSGPKVVAEMYGITKAEDIQPMMVNYVPELAELTFEEYEKFSAAINLPFIVSVNEHQLSNLNKQFDRVSYWILEEHLLPGLKGLQSQTPVLVKVKSKESITKIHEHESIKGVILSGSAEIRPGYKDYDELADVLEALDD